jgi:hypothetical protein
MSIRAPLALTMPSNPTALTSPEMSLKGRPEQMYNKCPFRLAALQAAIADSEIV